MKLKNYLREKIGWLVGILVQLAVIVLLGRLFQVNAFYIGTIIFFELSILTAYICTDFLKKRKFYNDILGKINELDKKYLIMEMVRACHLHML